ncbi:transmembrane protein, putative (macronuclear) [Tetrahymena thermophila SB210]|uniref:Transmembrane protein, putative n=1 Tax=Tetrahymena thermophila (strain SB210) TaxID=312017 RepID=Q24FI3_TETTS|nr:transmembrane protein, putative [Tetrahymena thermophila SB210]EAS06475.1 transmembrane protein, putative [Tetrahymena thermophila SB210]|eukprot:XP_001026720.1 transmembrane protein, putative [Tetrahymena thermophila SB210]
MSKLINGFITSIDIYSIGVNLNYKQSEKQKSFFGGFISILTFGIIGLVLWEYGKELYIKKNPIVIQSQRQIIQAQRVQVDKNNIIMMVGIQDQFSKSFVDPSYFTVKAVIQQLVQTTDPNTGQVNKSLKQYDREISACNLDDVGIEDLKPYFSSFKYSDYFCLKSRNQDEQNYIEGDFDEQSFSQIYIYIQKCTNSTDQGSVICKSPDQINNVMGNTKISLYLSDQLIVPTSFEQPFQNKGINLFSTISTYFQKEIQLYYTNSYIDTDQGIFYPDIYQIRGFSFVTQSEVIYHDQSNTICRVLLRLRKQKEDYMQRRYEKVLDVTAQVGGLLKIITMIGAILLGPFQRLYYNKNLVNQLFSFQLNEITNENKNEQPQLISEEQNSDKQQKQSQQVQETNEIIKQVPDIQRDQSINANQLVFSQSNKKSKIKNAMKIFDTSQQTIQYKFFDYLKHFFCSKRKALKSKKILLDYSIKKLNQNLDILHILNKMIEIDKLKYLIFDEDQMKLFEFIPKPKIGLNDIEIDGQKEFTSSQNTNIISKNKQRNSHNYYFQADKTSEEKAKDAQLSFLKIYQKKNKSKIDEKLINTIDPNMIKSINSNNNLVSKLLTPVSLNSSMDISVPHYNSYNNCQIYSNQTQNHQSKKQTHFRLNQLYQNTPDNVLSQQRSQDVATIEQQQQQHNDENSVIDSCFITDYEATGINLVKNNTNFFDQSPIITQNREKNNNSQVSKLEEIQQSKLLGDFN